MRTLLLALAVAAIAAATLQERSPACSAVTRGNRDVANRECPVAVLKESLLNPFSLTNVFDEDWIDWFVSCMKSGPARSIVNTHNTNCQILSHVTAKKIKEAGKCNSVSQWNANSCFRSDTTQEYQGDDPMICHKEETVDIPVDRNPQVRVPGSYSPGNSDGWEWTLDWAASMNLSVEKVTFCEPKCVEPEENWKVVVKEWNESECTAADCCTKRRTECTTKKKATINSISVSCKKNHDNCNVGTATWASEYTGIEKDGDIQGYDVSLVNALFKQVAGAYTSFF